MSLQSEKIANQFDISPSVHVQWDTQLRWMPDSRGLAYVDTRDGVQNLWVQLLDGSPGKQLTNFNDTAIFAYDWSRTGTLIISRGVITGDVVLITDAGK
jgi:Tol biopolymer transport system component